MLDSSPLRVIVHRLGFKSTFRPPAMPGYGQPPERRADNYMGVSSWNGGALLVFEPLLSISEWRFESQISQGHQTYNQHSIEHARQPKNFETRKEQQITWFLKASASSSFGKKCRLASLYSDVHNLAIPFGFLTTWHSKKGAPCDLEDLDAGVNHSVRPSEGGEGIWCDPETKARKREGQGVEHFVCSGVKRIGEIFYFICFQREMHWNSIFQRFLFSDIFREYLSSWALVSFLLQWGAWQGLSNRSSSWGAWRFKVSGSLSLSLWLWLLLMWLMRANVVSCPLWILCKFCCSRRLLWNFCSPWIFQVLHTRSNLLPMTRRRRGFVIFPQTVYCGVLSRKKTGWPRYARKVPHKSSGHSESMVSASPRLNIKVPHGSTPERF